MKYVVIDLKSAINVPGLLHGDEEALEWARETGFDRKNWRSTSTLAWNSDAVPALMDALRHTSVLYLDNDGPSDVAEAGMRLVRANYLDVSSDMEDITEVLIDRILESNDSDTFVVVVPDDYELDDEFLSEYPKITNIIRINKHGGLTKEQISEI